MDPSKAQTIFQIAVVVFTILAILSGYGAYHYSKKASGRETKELKQHIDKAVLEIKGAILEGDRQLIDQAKKQSWTFKEGTILLWIYKENFFVGKELQLNIISEVKDEAILLRKDAKDYVQLIYKNPQIGSISKGTQITADDFPGQNAVMLGFTWNLSEAKTALYVNGSERVN